MGTLVRALDSFISCVSGRQILLHLAFGDRAFSASILPDGGPNLPSCLYHQTCQADSLISLLWSLMTKTEPDSTEQPQVVELMQSLEFGCGVSVRNWKSLRTLERMAFQAIVLLQRLSWRLLKVNPIHGGKFGELYTSSLSWKYTMRLAYFRALRVLTVDNSTKHCFT